MQVIDHQHVRREVAPLAQCDLTQVVQAAHAVHVGEEARLAIIARLHDVLRDVGEIQPWLTRHGGAVLAWSSFATQPDTVCRDIPRCPVGKFTLTPVPTARLCITARLSSVPP